jgi:hypothetical protein
MFHKPITLPPIHNFSFANETRESNFNYAKMAYDIYVVIVVDNFLFV